MDETTFMIFDGLTSNLGRPFSIHSLTKEIQKDLLRYELALAMELDLPVNLHSREAHDDLLEILNLPDFMPVNGADDRLEPEGHVVVS